MSLSRPSYALILVALTACGPDTPTAAPDRISNEILLQDLNASYVDARECVQIGTRPRDGVIAQAPSIRPNASLDVLVNEGLLTRELDGIAFKYFLKDEIESKLEASDASQGYSSGIPKLCLADIEVVSVLSFTEPAEIQQSLVSNVTYTTRLTAIEPWAKAAFSDPDYVTRLTGEVRQVSSDMLLTEIGWRLQREPQK